MNAPLQEREGYSTEAEFMNVQFAKVSGHNLESCQTWGSVYNVYITNQFKTTFAQGGGEGVKFVCGGDCE